MNEKQGTQNPPKFWWQYLYMQKGSPILPKLCIVSSETIENFRRYVRWPNIDRGGGTYKDTRQIYWKQTYFEVWADSSPLLR